MEFTTLRFDSIDSTNTEVIRQAVSGAAEGLVVVATEQTAGRGRQGRQWISVKASGLYLSILLRPKSEPRFLPLITLTAAIAIYDLLADSFGLSPDIKWPNDILINEKKICGILAETAETPHGLAVVVGIGINLRSTNFPPELAKSATSLQAEAVSSKTLEIESLLLRFFEYWYEIFQLENGPTSIIDAWSKRSTNV
jgi:BirA family biotin operon repressor/biotin-[acetyl-CoA-carboxylase] ligase